MMIKNSKEAPVSSYTKSSFITERCPVFTLASLETKPVPVMRVIDTLMLII